MVHDEKPLNEKFNEPSILLSVPPLSRSLLLVGKLDLDTGEALPTGTTV